MLRVQAKDKEQKMRDMRNTPAGNPTVTEDYDEFDDNGNRTTPDYDDAFPVHAEDAESVEVRGSRYLMKWEDSSTLRIWDTETWKLVFDGPVTAEARNLFGALGAKIPDNPYEYPTESETFEVWVVDVSDDEYRGHEEGPFWNEEDATRFAEGNPGYFGTPSRVFRKTITIYGKRP